MATAERLLHQAKDPSATIIKISKDREEGKDEAMSNDLVVLIVMIVLLIGGALLLNFQIRRTERKDKLEQAAKENAVKSTGAAPSQRNSA